MGCASELLQNPRVRREALHQLELVAGHDDDAKLTSFASLALAVLDQLADDAAQGGS